MKIDLVRTIIAIGIGALTGWGFYTMLQDSLEGRPAGFVTGVEIALLSMGLFGISYKEAPRSGIMVRATCALGMLILLVLNSIYAYLGIYDSFYILNGIIALVLLLIANTVYTSKQ